MAKIKEKTLRFPPSPSPDVVGYNLYIEPASNGESLSYQSESVRLTDDTDENGNVVVNLGDIEVLRTMDGRYDIGVTAIDDGGNESSMSTMLGVELDFTAPDAPGALEIL